MRRATYCRADATPIQHPKSADLPLHCSDGRRTVQGPPGAPGHGNSIGRCETLSLTTAAACSRPFGSRQWQPALVEASPFSADGCPAYVGRVLGSYRGATSAAVSPSLMIR